MFTREKIFNVYEKPEAHDPAERVVLVREGFSLWASVFALVWLLYKRLWLAAVFYLIAIGSILLLADAWQLSEAHVALVQCWLQLMLGFHAADVQGWTLKRKGYRLAGVLAAENEMLATRRYFEFAA